MKSVSETFRCANLYRLDQLEGFGITGSQYTYILNICRNPGISQEQLSKLIYIHKSNVARQVCQLADKGLIERKTDENDKRSLLLYPTQKAKELYPKITSVLAEWNRLLLEDLTEQDARNLAELMERIAGKAKRETEKLALTERGGKA